MEDSGSCPGEGIILVYTGDALGSCVSVILGSWGVKLLECVGVILGSWGVVLGSWGVMLGSCEGVVYWILIPLYYLCSHSILQIHRLQHQQALYNAGKGIGSTHTSTRKAGQAAAGAGSAAKPSSDLLLQLQHLEADNRLLEVDNKTLQEEMQELHERYLDTVNQCNQLQVRVGRAEEEGCGPGCGKWVAACLGSRKEGCWRSTT